MKKASVIKFLTFLLVLAAFNVVLYLITGFDFSTSSWIAYGAIHFSFFVVLCGMMTALGKKRDVSAVLAQRTITYVYSLLVLIAGVVFFCIDTDDVIPVIITQIILFVGFGVVSSSQRSAESATNAARASLNADKQYIDEATSKLRTASKRTTSSDTLKKIDLAYDIIHSSPIQSTGDARIVEQRIMNCISELENALRGGNESEAKSIAERIIDEANERNSLLK